MKLYALIVIYKGMTSANWLKCSCDLTSFSLFQRRSVQEFLAFVSKTIVERTCAPSRLSVKEGEYMCHVYVRADNLAGVLICDYEYPQRVAHTLITKVLDEFASKIPSSAWATGSETTIDFPQINVYLAKYQNPREADAMTKIQDELDETKIILYNTMEALLERGEKLDNLLAKSKELSERTKIFCMTTRKTNSCCTFG